MIGWIRALAVLSSGLYAGIILGDRLGASYARPLLSAESFVLFQQTQHVHFKPVLMPLTIIALLTALSWVALGWRMRARSELWLAGAAAMATLTAFLITRIINFPINDALMTWSAAAPPSNVRELWAPWEEAHTYRSIAGCAAFALQVLALSASRR